MKSRGAPSWWLPGSVVAVVLALVGTVGFLLLDRHQDRTEAQRIQRVNAERVADDWEASLAVAKAEAAEQKEAAAKKAARQKAARVSAARKEAAQKKADKVATRQRARQRAIKRASNDAAALEAAAELALEELAENGHDLRGQITVPAVNGALVAAAGGYPGQSVSSMSKDKQERMGVLLASLNRGSKYPCSGGAGGSYGDLLAGTEVVVTHGETGGVIASTALVGGLLDKTGCTFAFAVRVPDVDSYEVEVASRGAKAFTNSSLTAAAWFVDMGL